MNDAKVPEEIVQKAYGILSVALPIESPYRLLSDQPQDVQECFRAALLIAYQEGRRKEEREKKCACQGKFSDGTWLNHGKDMCMRTVAPICDAELLKKDKSTVTVQEIWTIAAYERYFQDLPTRALEQEPHDAE